MRRTALNERCPTFGGSSVGLPMPQYMRRISSEEQPCLCLNLGAYIKAKFLRGRHENNSTIQPTPIQVWLEILKIPI